METQDQKKEFTGVWIPKHIIEDEDLSWTEIILYSEIASFEICYKTNEGLAKRLRLKNKINVSLLLTNLKNKGYIKEVKNDGRKKYWKAILTLSKGKSEGRVNKKVNSHIINLLTPNDNKNDVSPNNNGANNEKKHAVDTIIDNNKINTQNSANSGSEIFNSKEYIGQMINDKQKHISLIGRYFKGRGSSFPSKKAVQAEIRRWLKVSIELVEYPEKQITAVFNFVLNKYPDMWNLGTMAKSISNPLIWQ